MASESIANTIASNSEALETLEKKTSVTVTEKSNEHYQTIKRNPFINALLNPVVLTTLISAFVAPFAIVIVNSYMKNKEMQQQVLNTVLKHTDGQDFSKVQAIEKIMIMASFVNENSSTFGLQFEETMKSIETLKRAGIHSVNAELQSRKEDIAAMNQIIADNSQEIVSVNDQLRTLRQQKNDMENLLIGKSVRERERLQKSIDSKTLDIEAKTKELQLLQANEIKNAEALRIMESHAKTLAEDLKKSQQNVDRLMIEGKQLDERLKANMLILEGKSKDNDALTKALTETNAKLQSTSAAYESLFGQMTISKAESSKLAQDLAAAQTEIKNLQKKLAELSTAVK